MILPWSSRPSIPHLRTACSDAFSSILQMVHGIAYIVPLGCPAPRWALYSLHRPSDSVSPQPAMRRYCCEHFFVRRTCQKLAT